MRDVDYIPSPEAKDARSPEIVLEWDFEVCNHHSASAFNRLSSAIERSSARRAVLDMSKCRYLSVSGLRCLLEWNADLMRRGVELRLSGLSPMLTTIFVLSRLEWLLADQ